jgi:putative transposase
VATRRHNVEEIVATLRRMENLTETGMSVSAAAKSLGITDQTFYRWRSRYGSLPEDEAKRLQLLDEENARLKRVIAEQSQDVSMLQDLTQGEIVSAARRREAVDYLVERYQISERRACRLVGQHRSTQRYGAPERVENGVANGSPFSDLDHGHGHGGVGDGERRWHGGVGRENEVDRDDPGRHTGNGWGHGNDAGTPGLAPVRTLPFVDERVPCLKSLRTSLVHDVAWLTRDSEVARFLAANPVVRRLEAIVAMPQGLVRRARGHGDGIST